MTIYTAFLQETRDTGKGWARICHKPDPMRVEQGAVKEN